MSAGPTAGKEFIETTDGKMSDQTLQKRQLPYLVRSLLYSALSLLALISGFVMSGVKVEWTWKWGSVVILLAGLWACCSPFFWMYCAIFTAPRPSYWKILFRAAFGFGVCAFVIGVLIYHTTSNEWPSRGVGGIFGLLILTTLGYTISLPKLAKNRRFRVRHQVVWPVLLSIGFPLYIGLRYADLTSHAFLASLPIVVVVTFAIVSQVRQGLLVLGGVLCFAGAILVSTLVRDLRIYMLSMMYSTIGAAYLASFEAWHLTSELERKKRSNSSEQLNSSGRSTRPQRWYYGVTIAITISALAIPTLYVYSSLSPLLLLLLGLHSGIAFGRWSAARAGDRLVRWNWGGWKIAMGSFVLIVLPCDVLLLSRWRSSPPIPLPMSPLLFTFIAFLSAPALFRLREVIDEWRDKGVENLLSTTERSVAIVFYLAAIGVGFTILLYLSPVASDPWRARTTHACVMYLLYWIGAYMHLVRKWFSVKQVTL